MAPLVLIVGRISATATGVRGPAFALGQGYCTAVARAGGVPLMLPPIVALNDRLDDLLAKIDAVVLHGGPDIDPARYGATTVNDAVYGVEPAHDEVELAVARAVVAANKPLLAICRGMQVLNVALGGTLHQDIGTEDHWFAHRAIDVESGSLVATALGSPKVSSHCVHHQGLDRIADGLRIVGCDHHDGSVHAVEVPTMRFGVGVQWHPEDTAADDPHQQSLFNALLAST